MEKARQSHYLRDNKREMIPHHVLIFDTETRAIDDEDRTVQVLRLWCAAYAKRDGDEFIVDDIEEYQGHTADELAELCTKLAKNRKTLWIYAHNLSFDLIVTRLPIVLLAMGWEMTDQGLHTDAPWARFTKGENRITLADSFSVLPTSVQHLAISYGMTKPALPDWEDTDEAWFHRCHEDVAITARSVLDCLSWWSRNHVGNWSLTGASCGWNAMRHMWMPTKVVIDQDDDARKFERQAIMAGRREVWKAGEQSKGVYLDIDFEHAHLTVCAEYPLPHRRMMPFDELPLDSPFLSVQSMDILAEVEIECDVPRYPVRSASGIFYPVGHFFTTLCGPEIREARERGELVSIRRGYVYQMAHIMRPFALWIRDMIDNPADDLPPAVGVMVKGWSRSVPGKWAAHSSKLVDSRYDPRPGWMVEDGAIIPGNIPAVFMLINHEWRTYAMDQESENAFPAILAFIQSYTRMQLSRLIDEVGPAVLQTNTDGCLVDGVRWANNVDSPAKGRGISQKRVLEICEQKMERVNLLTYPLKARWKKACSRVDVLSPQHVILDGELRLAGIPKKAQEVGPRQYTYTVWPRTRSQLKDGAKKGFTQEHRTADLSKVPVNRWRLTDGSCAPVKMRSDELVMNQIEPWQGTGGVHETLMPMEYQHMELREVMRGGGTYNQ